MFQINNSEREQILEMHQKFKKLLSEQAAQTPDFIDVQTKNAAIAQKIVGQNICFCKQEIATCSSPIIKDKSIIINARMAVNSSKVNSSGQPLYKAGDTVAYNVSDFTFTAPQSTTKHNWTCAAINDIIGTMRQDVIANYNQLGYKTLEGLGKYAANAEDPKRYDKIQLNLKYPFLFPKWMPINRDDLAIYTLYKAKSQDISADESSEPQSDEERIRIEQWIKKDPTLVTKKTAMEKNGVEDFARIASLYTAVQIGTPNDSVFGRPFYLYRLKSGQAGAKNVLQTSKQSEKTLQINKPMCAKLIKQLYELYKLKDAAFTTMSEEEIAQLKMKVTYCSRKYDNYGLLGGDKIDAMVSELKGLPNSNKFNID